MSHLAVKAYEGGMSTNKDAFVLPKMIIWIADSFVISSCLLFIKNFSDLLPGIQCILSPAVRVTNFLPVAVINKATSAKYFMWYSYGQNMLPKHDRLKRTNNMVIRVRK